jgi:hypothetical protein
MMTRSLLPSCRDDLELKEGVDAPPRMSATPMLHLVR